MAASEGLRQFASHLYLALSGGNSLATVRAPCVPVAFCSARSRYICRAAQLVQVSFFFFNFVLYERFSKVYGNNRNAVSRGRNSDRAGIFVKRARSY